MPRSTVVLALALTAGLFATDSASAGSLVLVGGGMSRDDREAHRQIFKRRFKRRPLCVIASGQPKPLPAMRAKVSDFEDHMGAKGPRFVLGLPLTSTSAKATNPAVINAFARCGGFFVADGNADRIAAVFNPEGETSATTTVVRRAFSTGAVVSGTGAGAKALGDRVIADGSSAEALAHGIVDDAASKGLKMRAGIGIWKGVAIEDRALAEGRFGRLLVAARASEQRLGFAIDLGTSLMVDEVHGDSPRALVLGDSQVIIVDAGAGENPDRFFLLGAGDGFDLAARVGKPMRTPRGDHRRPITQQGTVEGLDAPWIRDTFHRGLIAFAISGSTAWRVGVGASAIEITKGEGFEVLGARERPYAGPFEVR
ncbi:MAG: hypothetical protein AAGF23_22435 [Acidobacteriota bacterium]